MPGANAGLADLSTNVFHRSMVQGVRVAALVVASGYSRCRQSPDQGAYRLPSMWAPPQVRFRFYPLVRALRGWRALYFAR